MAFQLTYGSEPGDRNEKERGRQRRRPTIGAQALVVQFAWPSGATVGPCFGIRLLRSRHSPPRRDSRTRSPGRGIRPTFSLGEEQRFIGKGRSRYLVLGKLDPGLGRFEQYRLAVRIVDSAGQVRTLCSHVLILFECTHVVPRHADAETTVASKLGSMRYVRRATGGLPELSPTTASFRPETTGVRSSLSAVVGAMFLSPPTPRVPS